MRMQRSRTGTIGLRMKTSREISSFSTLSAKAPSAPQSTVTKLAADGMGESPLSIAIFAILSRPAATFAFISPR